MASRDPQTQLIGRYEYKVTPLGGRQGARVLSRLMKLMGRGAGAGNELEAVGAMLASLEEQDLEYFIAAFEKFTAVHIGDKWPPLEDIFDAHFVSDYLEMLGWLKFALEVNFNGFFSGALGLAGQGASPAPSK